MRLPPTRLPQHHHLLKITKRYLFLNKLLFYQSNMLLDDGSKSNMLKQYKEYMKKSLHQCMVLDDELMPIYSKQRVVQLPPSTRVDVHCLDRDHFITNVRQNNT